MAWWPDDAGSPKVPRVHSRKQVLVCPVAVAELAEVILAARPDASPTRQRHRVITVAGREHVRSQPRRPQLVLHITSP